MTENKVWLTSQRIVIGCKGIIRGSEYMVKYSIEELKAIINPIARKYGIAKVYLFGSLARGDANENSDIDLLIDKGTLKGLFALGGFYNELSEALGVEIDILTTGSLDETFLDEIKEEEVLLYAG